MVTVTDRNLLVRFARDDDDEAFRKIVERYYGLVYGAAHRKTGWADLAGDVAQTVFLVFAARAKRLPTSIALGGWLYKASLLASNNVIRAESRRARCEMEAARMQAIQTMPSNDPDLAPLLDDGLMSLSEGDRDALLLQYVLGFSSDELADALHITPPAARKRVSRGLERLRRHYASAGISLSIAALASFLAEQSAKAAPISSSIPVHPSLAISGAQVSTLYQGVIKEMAILKIKMIATSVVVGACLLGAGAALLSHTNALSRAAAVLQPQKSTDSLYHFSGKVVDQNGRPMSGVDVMTNGSFTFTSSAGVRMPVGLTFQPAHPGLPGDALTNSQGEFSYQCALVTQSKVPYFNPNIEVGLLFLARNYPENCLYAKSGSAITMKMLSGNTIRGSFFDSSGAPARHIRVAAFDMSHFYASTINSTVSDRSGRFEIPHVLHSPDAVLYVKMQDLASRGLYFPLTKLPGMKDGVPYDFGKLSLKPAGNITGRIILLASAQKRVKSLKASIIRSDITLDENRGDMQVINIPVNSNGSFAIHGIPLNENLRFRLEINDGRLGVRVQDVRIPVGQKTLVLNPLTI